MRLLSYDEHGGLTFTGDLTDNIPPYAILSHTWGKDTDEVTFADLQRGVAHQKPGYVKIQFCSKQAKKDKINHFWIDTCCIDKTNNTELSEAIVSMFRWYRDAQKCYVYLSDVSDSTSSPDSGPSEATQLAMRNSRWFKRGWTLQELLAPKEVEFFSLQQCLIGTKVSLLKIIHEITGIAVAALQGAPLSHYSLSERMQWAANRQTKKVEDKAYCLFGIFDVYLPLIYGEGENAFPRLQEAIDKKPEFSQTSKHEHWCVPRTANTLFTGRTQILEDLEIFIRGYLAKPAQGERCRVVISGIGGQGKSEICLQLAQRLRNRFWAVLWIDVSSEVEAERSYLDVARKLSIPAETWEDARHNIANLKHPWLMILDNADDLAIDYSVYFPDGNPGIVILTSRNDECQTYASTDTGSIVLDGLLIKDAQSLLQKAANIPQDRRNEQEHQAEAVAKLLQSHALALVQAGAYIANGHCTLSEYPRMYEKRRQRLLKFQPRQAKSRYGDFYTTFEVSAEMLINSNEQSAQDALQLLPMLAICGPTRFPLVIFEKSWEKGHYALNSIDENAPDPRNMLLTSWHASYLPAFSGVADDEWDIFRLSEAVRTLRSLSLITLVPQDGQSFVSMHALVHAWARERQSRLETHQSWLSMACAIAFAMKSKKLSPQDNRNLQAHCVALTSWDMEEIYGSEPAELVTRIMARCGWYFENLGAFAHLDALVHRIMQKLQLDVLQVDADYLGLYRLLAASLRDISQFRGSLVLSEQIVRIQDHLLAEDHPDRLKSQHSLAMAYRVSGEVSKAVALLEHVVEVRERVLAEDHPYRLSSQHELAGAYHASGEVSKAVALLEHVVEVRERVLAEDHPSRLKSQHALAMAYRDSGEVGKAVNLLEHVVEVDGRVLAEDDPSRLASQHNLATYYWDLGRHELAGAMMMNVVNVRKRSLANDHPDRLNSEEWLEDMQWEMTGARASAPRDESENNEAVAERNTESEISSPVPKRRVTNDDAEAERPTLSTSGTCPDYQAGRIGSTKPKMVEATTRDETRHGRKRLSRLWTDTRRMVLRSKGAGNNTNRGGNSDQVVASSSRSR